MLVLIEIYSLALFQLQSNQTLEVYLYKVLIDTNLEELAKESV